jgi:hypothetical protein
LYQEDLESSKTTPINFRVFSSDYTSPIGKQITMETGAKISLSRFTNDAGTSKLEHGEWVLFENLSAKYLLKENIDAAYASMNIKLSDNLSAKAGLRYEYTTSNLGTTATANIVDRKYGELFPTLYISQKFDEGSQFNFI